MFICTYNHFINISYCLAPVQPGSDPTQPKTDKEGKGLCSHIFNGLIYPISLNKFKVSHPMIASSLSFDSNKLPSVLLASNICPCSTA